MEVEASFSFILIMLTGMYKVLYIVLYIARTNVSSSLPFPKNTPSEKSATNRALTVVYILRSIVSI